MNAVYEQLVKRIRGEVDDLDAAVKKTQRAWNAARKATADQDLYVDSVALNLHSFYSGLEALFELIARNLDQTMPSGETWHRDLLNEMALELPDVRPAVISADNAAKLSDYLRFRHLVRNIYAANLSPSRMEGLITGLPGLWRGVRQELLAFAELLDHTG